MAEEINSQPISPQERKKQELMQEEARKAKRMKEINEKILGSKRKVNFMCVMQLTNNSSIKEEDFDSEKGFGQVTFLSYDEKAKKFEIELEIYFKTGTKYETIKDIDLSDIRD